MKHISKFSRNCNMRIHRIQLRKSHEVTSGQLYQYNSVLDISDTLYRKGKLQEAIQELKKIPVFHPIAKEKEAAIYFKLNDFEKSLKVFRETFDQGRDILPLSNLSLLQAQMAECYFSLGDLEGSLNCYEKGIQVHPSDHEAYERYGYFLLKLYKVTRPLHQDYASKCLDCFEKSLSLKKEKNSDALHGLGMTHYLLRNYEKSVAIFEQLLEADPNYYLTHVHLGSSYYAIGQYKDAQHHFEQFLNHYNDFMVSIGNNYIGLSHSNTFNPQDMYIEAEFKRCMCIVAGGDWPLAIHQLSTFIASVQEPNPMLPLVYNKRGYCYFRRTEFWKCVEDNTKALQLNNKLYEAYRDRRDAYKCLGLEKEAKDDSRMYEALLREKSMTEWKTR